MPRVEIRSLLTWISTALISEMVAYPTIFVKFHSTVEVMF